MNALIRRTPDWAIAAFVGICAAVFVGLYLTLDAQAQSLAERNQEARSDVHAANQRADRLSAEKVAAREALRIANDRLLRAGEEPVVLPASEPLTLAAFYYARSSPCHIDCADGRGTGRRSSVPSSQDRATRARHASRSVG